MPVTSWRAASCTFRPLEIDYTVTILSSISLVLQDYCEASIIGPKLQLILSHSPKTTRRLKRGALSHDFQHHLEDLKYFDMAEFDSEASEDFCSLAMLLPTCC